MQKIPYFQVFERTRVLGSVVAPRELEFVTEPPMGMKSGPVILHISCQVHNVPHIPYLAQKIMKALGIDFITLGGPENCCGAFHWHFGDEDMERQVANISLAAFQRLRAQTVLSLCPDCDYSFGRYHGKQHRYRHLNVSEIFVEHMDALKRHMTKPVKKRVILHYHTKDEMRQRDADNIRSIIGSVPGIEILDAPKSLGPGFHCQTVAPMPADATAEMFAEAKAMGADYLVVPYHSCYRQHCKMQLQYGVEVQYYLGLVAMAMGLPFEEKFKELRLLDDVDLAMERLRPRIRELGHKEEEVRKYVQGVVYL
jgi:heterodisulfide reductase subunit B